MASTIESLAQTRHAERYRASQRAAATTAVTAAVRHDAADTRRDAADARRDGCALATTRSRAGWVLVGLGLRLALPGRHAGPHRITLNGR